MRNILKAILSRSRLLKIIKSRGSIPSASGMEVTKNNFKEAYSLLEQELPSADFIAIDGEFTGLSSIREKAPGYDTLEEKYQKTCMGTSKMMLIQYGISLFTWREETKNYKAMPFTFYIFPRPYRKYSNDVVFTCQSSSLDFLYRNGFDFNKLFHEGVSFMRKDAETYARAKIEERLSLLVVNKNTDGTKPPGDDEPEAESRVCIPEKLRPFIDDTCRSVCDFMKDDKQKVMDLPPCDHYQRQLIYDVMGEKYPLGLYLECVTTTEEVKHIRCHKTSGGCINTKDLKRQEEEDVLDQALGFSKVMHLLSESKKPVIGHNMFLDLFLTWTNFYNAPPPSLHEFKESMLNIFPVLFDTKLMATASPANQVVYSTGLGNIISCIENETLPIPDVYISEELGNDYEYTEQYHQAGFDAYCTGRVFLSVGQYILSSQGKPCERIDLELLERFRNCVFLMGVRDTAYTDFSKEDAPPDRRNVFHVQFPPGWKNTDLDGLFLPYSPLSYPINWINDTSAFVTVYDEGRLDDIHQNLVCNSGAEYEVLQYDDYIKRKRELQSNGGPVSRKRPRTESNGAEITMNDGSGHEA